MLGVSVRASVSVSYGHMNGAVGDYGYGMRRGKVPTGWWAAPEGWGLDGRMIGVVRGA